MYKIFVVLIALVFSTLMIQPSYAQLGDITAAETTTVDVVAFVDGDEKSYTVGAVMPYEKINGGFQAYLTQQQSKGEVVSENARVRIEGGWDLWKLQIIGFVEFERLFKEGTTTRSVGPFVRLPAYVDGDLKITSGLGSWLQNQEVQAEVGADAALSAYSVRPFVYASADYGPANLFGKVSTDYSDYNDLEAELVPSLVLSVGNNWSIGLLAQYRYARLSDMGITSRYSAVGRYVFD